MGTADGRCNDSPPAEPATHVSGPLEELLLDLLEPALARWVESLDGNCRRVGLRRMVAIVSQLHGHRRLDAIGEDVIRAGLELVRFQRDLDVLVAGDADDVHELAERCPR